jgi:hypothetical protein
MSKEAKPWEMQEGETSKQFEAFVVYRDMENRGIRKVAERLQKSETLIGRWSSKNNWVDRVAAWDAEKDRIARQEQIKDIKKMRDRHAKGAMAMFGKALEGLKTINPEELSAQDIVRMFAESTKVERLSRGDTSEVIEERQGEAVNAVQIYIPSNSRERENTNFDDLEV